MKKMIKGIGTDLVEIARIDQILKEQPRFVERILTEQEKKYFSGLSPLRQTEFVAGRFAAKEALSKALQTGIGPHFSWKDVSILPSEGGAPQVIWHGRQERFSTHISITHTAEYALAYVVLEEKNS
nr:holo-ACP synthase [Caldalkalibacillus mannanilyticus]